jgi:hypothetical protein
VYGAGVKEDGAEGRAAGEIYPILTIALDVAFEPPAFLFPSLTDLLTGK